MNLDLACVSSFLVLVEEQHFGRAASRLSMTSSALTKRIQRLEHQVGAQLVERGPSGFSAITPAGLRFAHHARPLLRQALQAQEAARSDGAAQTIRLGVPGVLGEYPHIEELRSIGRALHHAFPTTYLRCLGIPFSQLTESLTSEQVDVIWTAARTDHRGVESMPIATVPRVGVVASHHELGRATELPADEFLDLRMIHNPVLPEEWMSLWYFGDLRPAAQAHLVSIPAERSLTVFHHVMNGSGVTAMPAPLAARLPPQLHPITITDAPPVVFHAVRRAGDRRHVVGALIQIVACVAATSVHNASVPRRHLAIGESGTRVRFVP